MTGRGRGRAAWTSSSTPVRDERVLYIVPTLPLPAPADGADLYLFLLLTAGTQNVDQMMRTCAGKRPRQFKRWYDIILAPHRGLSWQDCKRKSLQIRSLTGYLPLTPHAFRAFPLHSDSGRQ